MILIDALYVNMGGAFQLLKYLIDTLEKRSVSYFLLADARCAGKLDDVSQICYLDATLKNRKIFYKRGMVEDISSVFCFGNVPPPVKLGVPVYTYFHNINMLTLSDCRNRKQWILFWLKRAYIKTKKHNTDWWFVQTSNTANELMRNLRVSKDRVCMYPFYQVPVRPDEEPNRTDYIFAGEYSGSKGHDELLAAWRILHGQGINSNLHLTVTEDGPFKRELERAVEEGVPIVNHGFMSKDELSRLYLKCKATVYPSKNESFGLGLVEAMELGCDVIGADRPYVYAICEPSEVFDQKNPDDIAEAIIRYESGISKQTKQCVCDRVNEMINQMVG